MTDSSSKKSEAFRKASRERDPGIVREFVSFLAHNKKWWLIPILIIMVLLGCLVMLGKSAIAPFIYTLF